MRVWIPRTNQNVYPASASCAARHRLRGHAPYVIGGSRRHSCEALPRPLFPRQLPSRNDPLYLASTPARRAPVLGYRVGQSPVSMRRGKLSERQSCETRRQPWQSGAGFRVSPVARHPWLAEMSRVCVMSPLALRACVYCRCGRAELFMSACRVPPRSRDANPNRCCRFSPGRHPPHIVFAHSP